LPGTAQIAIARKLFTLSWCYNAFLKPLILSQLNYQVFCQPEQLAGFLHLSGSNVARKSPTISGARAAHRPQIHTSIK